MDAQQLRHGWAGLGVPAGEPSAHLAAWWLTNRTVPPYAWREERGICGHHRGDWAQGLRSSRAAVDSRSMRAD
jgi:hypothetical protein